MKNILLLGVSLFGLNYSTYAQGFKLGVKGAVNFSELKSEKSWLTSESNTGYQLGVWTRIGAGVVHLQPEAYFTSKNMAIHVETKDAASDLINGDLKFSNIDIPILLGTKFPLGPINAKLQAGPLFSFAIDQEASFKNNIIDTFDKDILRNYKDKFSAVIFGAGFDLGRLAVDVRYEYGLGNISKYEGEKQTLNLWSVGLGYSFF